MVPSRKTTLSQKRGRLYDDYVNDLCTQLARPQTHGQHGYLSLHKQYRNTECFQTKEIPVACCWKPGLSAYLCASVQLGGGFPVISESYLCLKCPSPEHSRQNHNIMRKQQTSLHCLYVKFVQQKLQKMLAFFWWSLCWLMRGTKLKKSAVGKYFMNTKISRVYICCFHMSEWTHRMHELSFTYVGHKNFQYFNLYFWLVFFLFYLTFMPWVKILVVSISHGIDWSLRCSLIW